MASVTRAEVARTAKDALPLYTQAKGGRCRPMRQGLTAYGVGGEVVLPDGIEPAHKELQSSALPSELQKHRSSPRAAWSSSGDTVRRLRASVCLCGIADGTRINLLLLPCKYRRYYKAAAADLEKLDKIN